MRGCKELRIYEAQLEAALEQFEEAILWSKSQTHHQEKNMHWCFNGRGEQRHHDGGKNTSSRFGNEGKAFNANKNQPNSIGQHANEVVKEREHQHSICRATEGRVGLCT